MGGSVCSIGIKKGIEGLVCIVSLERILAIRSGRLGSVIFRLPYIKQHLLKSLP